MPQNETDLSFEQNHLRLFLNTHGVPDSQIELIVATVTPWIRLRHFGRRVAEDATAERVTSKAASTLSRLMGQAYDPNVSYRFTLCRGDSPLVTQEWIDDEASGSLFNWACALMRELDDELKSDHERADAIEAELEQVLEMVLNLEKAVEIAGFDARRINPYIDSGVWALIITYVHAQVHGEHKIATRAAWMLERCKWGIPLCRHPTDQNTFVILIE